MFDTVVLGGTYTAVGFCSANSGRNLIISDSVYLEDYSPAFRFAPVSWHTEAGKAFLETLPVRGNIVSLGEAALAVYRRAQERKWEILYQTFVTEIVPQREGFVVTVQNWDGTRNILCRRVLDTRAQGTVLQKAYHCLVEHAPEAGEYETFSILPAYWEGQSVLRIPLEQGENMQQARQRLRGLLEQKELRKTKIILMGLAFDQRVQPETETALPSCNCENLIESYEQGYAAGLRIAGGAK